MSARIQSKGSSASALQASLEAMREIGIDISGQTSKDVDLYNGEKFDYVITVCDRAMPKAPPMASIDAAARIQSLEHSTH